MRRVLVVDDDHDILKMVRHILVQHYDVVTADDGQLGLEKALEQPHPDLIVTDVAMPNLDGLEMAQALKAQAETKNIPVIFLTSRDQPADVIDGIKAGARHYITKPFKMSELLATVSKILG